MSRLCVLITGGAGFIGSHAAVHWAAQKWRVIIVDNFSHPGSRENLKRLKELPNVDIIDADAGDSEVLNRAFNCGPRVDIVLHSALRRADSEAFKEPKPYFDVNVVGTFRLLEIIRQFSKGRRPRLIIFPSTRKVYGSLSQLKIRELDRRYRFDNGAEAIAESQPLSFEGPYGCSMGSAEQYVHDYSRIYHLPTVVLRLSTIYGPQHYATPEQGWVTHMAIRAYLGAPLTIYGNGKQVRDLLYIEDLMRLFDALYDHCGTSVGKIYNVGGGIENSISVLELIEIFEKRLGRELRYERRPMRGRDQKVYVSDIAPLRQHYGWYPRVNIETGLDRTISWIKTHQDLIQRVLAKDS
ncbi:MAG: GDP-mannose 4,6-dehydratase [Elusimicrobia bacterium]|nr:GDP-mannose 4,6-dehydratase [Elusimicrobiota bacterium]